MPLTARVDRWSARERHAGSGAGGDTTDGTGPAVPRAAPACRSAPEAMSLAAARTPSPGAPAQPWMTAIVFMACPPSPAPQDNARAAGCGKGATISILLSTYPPSISPHGAQRNAGPVPRAEQRLGPASLHPGYDVAALTMTLTPPARRLSDHNARRRGRADSSDCCMCGGSGAVTSITPPRGCGTTMRRASRCSRFCMPPGNSQFSI